MILTVDTIQKAMTGQRVGTLDEASLKVALAQITTDVAALAGFESQIFGEQTDELARDIRGGYPRLTLDEIRLACKAGISGEFGVGGRPTYASVTRWVREYDNCAMVADARKWFARKPVEVRRLTEAEGLEVMRREMPEAARRRWESVRTTGSFPMATLPHVSAQIYDWLREEGVLHLDRADKEAAVEKAKRDMNSRSVWDVSGIEGGDNLIRSRAKHFALLTWMRRLHASGGRLELPSRINRIYE